ncbi:cell division protein FtsA, partial [candidate division WOR-3 bacterium]|nr:cell division protein FtsA [candidate division WOR-3 bacterium]
MKNQIIAGIDLGSSKITCMIAKTSASNPAPEIIGAGISEPKGFSNGLVVNLELAAQSIKNATSLAETQAGVKLSELFIAITGAHIRGESSNVSLSIPPDKEITPSDVSQLVQQASTVDLPSHRTIIHSFPQEFILDDLHGIRNPIGMNANRLQASIYIVTATSTAIQNIQKAINRANFKAREFLPQPIAASYAVLDSNDQELGCMLIDIGGETTDVAAFYNGGIYDTLSLGLGGADITNDISIGLSISRYHAEQLKIK